MIPNQTIEKLKQIRLGLLADVYREQSKQPGISELDFDERFAQLVDNYYLCYENKAMERRLKIANLKLANASVESVDYHTPRGLDKNLFKNLANLEWIRYHRNCLITGPTGIGKSFLACALGQKACRDGYKTLYKQSMKLFRELFAARHDGTLTKLLNKIAKFDLLIIDDFGMESAKPTQYRDFLELIDEIWNNGALIITSQTPPNLWHDFIREQTVADAIVDRIFHNAYFIELQGESMRKLNKHF